MRRSLVLFAALALGTSACDCGKKLSGIAPDLFVSEPKAKDGEAWLLDFGAVEKGTAVSLPIVIENHGSGDATLTSISLRQGSDPAFSLSGDEAPKGLGPGSSDTITVTFAPSLAGAALGWVDVVTTDAKLPKVAVKLTAQGQAPAAQVCVEGADGGAWDCAAVEGSSLSIDFGSMLVGTPAGARAVRVRNVGSAGMHYFGTALIDPSSPLFTLDPSQDVPAGGTLMAPAGELQFNVVYNPAVEGTVTGIAEVTTNDGTQPVVDITLKGTAAAALVCKLKAFPSRADFGNIIVGNTAELTVTVTNSGTQPCTITGLPVSGSTAFSLLGAPTPPTALGPGQNATFKVRYHPGSASSDTGTLTVDSDDPATPHLAIPLTGAGVAQPACLLVATPAALDFGGVTPGDRSIMAVQLSATGSEPCSVTGARIRNGNPNFKASVSTPLFIFPAGSGGGFGGGSVGVTYAPVAAGTDSDTLVISYSAGFFGGQPLTLNVPLSGKSGTRRLCVTPLHLHFGLVTPPATKSLPFTLSACGNAAVNVTAMTIEQGGPPFTLSPSPALPIALPKGSSATQNVLASPASLSSASAVVHIVSDDPVFRDQYVTLDIGQELVPPDAGEIMYSWTAGAFSAGGSMDGTIYRAYLQGPPRRGAYYGSQAGQQCSGCHAVSPDGRYVALIEYGTSATMRIIDARTGGSIPVPGTSNGQFPSWRPDVNTTPPYQFVYNDGNVLKVASLTAGVMREVQGANDPAFVQTQPSWGPNGKIAFVKGSPEDAGQFAISGPADLVIVPESGGVATPVAGASGNGGSNYYPEYSPNGKFLAYTYSPSGKTTRAASDSVIKLVEVANGSLKSLPQLNAAIPNSWPTWSRDGMYLSFSSTRSGGLGSADVYIAPVNQTTGVDGPASALNIVNTANYDHIARWAFLPP